MYKLVVCAILLQISVVLGCSRPSALKVVAEESGRLVGVAVEVSELVNNPIYQSRVVEEFNSITPENVMKFSELRPGPEEFNWAPAEQIIDFADKNNLLLRCHTLIWYRQLPEWVKNSYQDRSSAIELMKGHISEVVKRFKGKCKYWDVVNEAILSDGSYRNSFWYQTIGAEYVREAFIAARQADPAARLLYNDYDAVYPSPKFTAVFSLLQNLKEQGIPVDGIGLQMHLRPSFQPTFLQLEQTVAKFASLGIEVHFSEVDVAIEIPVNEEKLNWQATRYADLVKACVGNPACNSFTIWGLSDSHSWIPRHFPKLDSATIFNRDLSPKPAYYSIIEEFGEAE